MLRHRKTSQKSKGAAEKKTFLIGLLYFGEQEDVRMFFFNLVFLMRFLSKLSLSLARKNTWKGLFKLLDFPETILPPLFQVSSFGKCWSASGLPDRRFARSSRFTDWCSKKKMGKIKAGIYNCFQFMQTFSLASSNYMLVALSVDRWLIFYSKPPLQQ